MRCSFGFAALVALVAPVSALNYNKSLNSQTRLAYHGPTGMTISWNTYNQILNPTVQYGLTSDMPLTASSNTSVTYNTSLTYNNHVTLTNLLPDTVYYYTPTTLMSGDAGPYTFKTAKPAGVMDPYSVAVIVDMGTFGPEGLGTTAPSSVPANNVLKPGEQTTINSLTNTINQWDWLMHPGDIAYADTWLKEAQAGYIQANQTYAQGYQAYESILDDFYDQMTPITTIRPYMVGMGNHEANCDNGANLTLCMPGQMNFTGYRNHFRMPSDVAPSGPGLESFWYSYDYGMVHYIQIDTETDLGNGLVGPDEPMPGKSGNENSGPFGVTNQQIAWLTQDLASVNRSITPWVIVSGHRPWYSSGSVCANCQTAFETLFNQYSVDLYITGHFHVYERQAPVLPGGVADPNELNNPSAPWYITNGAAGHYNGLDSFSNITSYSRFRLSTADGIYGWSKLDFHNCTHMTQSFIASNNDTVLDSATLYKAANSTTGRCALQNLVAGSSSVSSSSTSSSASSAATSGTISASSSANSSTAMSSSTTSSVPATTTSASPLVCNRDNCLNELNDSRFSSMASGFCQTYTTTMNSAPSAIPSYLENCNMSPISVSSACSCLMAETHAPTPSTTSTTPAAGTVTATTTTPAPLVCNRDNCLNELNDSRFSAMASGFCMTYTTTTNTAPSAIPTYLENCNMSPMSVSSACSCIMAQTPTRSVPSSSAVVTTSSMGATVTVTVTSVSVSTVTAPCTTS